MANFKKVAGRLGLEDLDKDFPGNKKCKDCGEELRLGKDKNNHEQSYCPKCGKIVRTVFVSRFPPGVRVELHDD